MKPLSTLHMGVNNPRYGQQIKKAPMGMPQTQLMEIRFGVDHVKRGWFDGYVLPFGLSIWGAYLSISGFAQAEKKDPATVRATEKLDKAEQALGRSIGSYRQDEDLFPESCEWLTQKRRDIYRRAILQSARTYKEYGAVGLGLQRILEDFKSIEAIPAPVKEAIDVYCAECKTPTNEPYDPEAPPQKRELMKLYQIVRQYYPKEVAYFEEQEKRRASTHHALHKDASDLKAKRFGGLILCIVGLMFSAPGWRMVENMEAMSERNDEDSAPEA